MTEVNKKILNPVLSGIAIAGFIITLLINAVSLGKVLNRVEVMELQVSEAKTERKQMERDSKDVSIFMARIDERLSNIEKAVITK
jgi:hypothetical protein